MRKSSSIVAFGGVIAALCLVLMLISGVLQVATLAIPALSGMLLMFIVIELGAKWAVCVYAVVSVFSILFVADKEAALMFTLFFGYYPILKSKLDIILPKILSWTLKFLVFNVAMILEYFAAIKILMVPSEEYVLFGVSIPLVLLFLANIVFLLYDRALVGIVIMYYQRLRNNLKFLRK